MSHPIVERLASADPAERRAACRAAVDDPSATLLVDALVERLADSDRGVGRAASDALARLARDVPEVVGRVRAALRSDDPALRWQAARTSARIEPPGPRLVPAAVEALGAADGGVRWEAARLLVDTGRVAGEVLPLLLGLVGGAHATSVRRMAAYCVRELAPERPEAADTLLEASRDPDLPVRRAALTALAALRDPPGAVFERLLEAAEDRSDGGSRPLALLGLAALAQRDPTSLPPAAIAVLQRVAAGEPNGELRASASRALRAIAEP